jgi:hypothetical protein
MRRSRALSLEVLEDIVTDFQRMSRSLLPVG